MPGIGDLMAALQMADQETPFMVQSLPNFEECRGPFVVC